MRGAKSCYQALANLLNEILHRLNEAVVGYDVAKKLASTIDRDLAAKNMDKTQIEQATKEVASAMAEVLKAIDEMGQNNH